MNTLAYLVFTHADFSHPLVVLINLCIYLIVALIIWLIVKTAAAEFGVSGGIVKLVGLVLFLILLLVLLGGCTTMTVTKPDGTVVTTRSQDPAVVSAIVTGVTNGAIQAGTAYLKNEQGLAK